MQSRRVWRPQGQARGGCDQRVTWQQMEAGTVITLGHSVALRPLILITLPPGRWWCCPCCVVCVLKQQGDHTACREVSAGSGRGAGCSCSPSCQASLCPHPLWHPGHTCTALLFCCPNKQRVRLRGSCLPESLRALRIWDLRHVKGFPH